MADSVWNELGRFSKVFRLVGGVLSLEEGVVND